MINTFKSTAFNVCENQPLQILKDTQMEVIIKPCAIPKRTMRTIHCPINLREQAKKNLEAGVKLGIIEPVQLNGEQPSRISPALFVLKSNGGCRQVVNFKHLNVHCERQPNHTSDVLKLVSQVPTALDSATKELFFTVLDAWNGYHSIALKDDAKKYFGFQTEWGTYTYNVAPQGFLGSGDYYTKKG